MCISHCTRFFTLNSFNGSVKLKGFAHVTNYKMEDQIVNGWACSRIYCLVINNFF